MALRWIQIWEREADWIHHLLKVFPPYIYGSAIYFEYLHKDFSDFREATRGTGRNVAVDPWAWENYTGYCASLAAHFVFWSLFILAIETGFAKKAKQLYSCCCKLRFPEPLDDLEMDEEVRDEEKRVMSA